MKKFVYWLPALAWMIVIWGFSAQPSLRVSDTNWADFILRKTAHFVEYFVLFFLYLLAIRKTTSVKSYNSIFFALILSILYAISDEAHQLTVLGREGAVRDVIIDSAGASAACFISQYLK